MTERKFEWYSIKDGIYAFLNPYYYIIDRAKDSKWSGWEERKIDFHSCSRIVSIRATHVDYDRKIIAENEKMPWLAYSLVKYEVKPNPYGIESIEYRKGAGWFLIGENINLFRKSPDDF